MLKNPIKRLFYVPKHSKATKRSPYGQIFLSLLSMIFFISCFASITWAWFTDTATSGLISITSAKYNVTATVVDLNGNKIKPDKSGSYSLENGDYKITMLANGTATKISGYCRMVIGSSEYYSPRLKVENSSGSKDLNEITFDLKLNEAAVISFSSSWEVYPNGEVTIIDVNKGITYGKEPVIAEDKKQDEDKAETDKSQEDTSEDNKEGVISEIESSLSEESDSSPQDVESNKSENTPAVIEDNKKENQKNSGTKNSQGNNEKSSDSAVKSPEATTDGTSEIVEYEDNEDGDIVNGN